MIYTSIKNLKGVGEKKAKLFAKLGVHTLFELIEYYPKRYDDMSKIYKIEDLEIGLKATFLARVVSISTNVSYNGKIITKVVVSDDNSRLNIIFLNARYISNMLKVDNLYYFNGTLTADKTVFYPEFVSFEDKPNGFGIRPVYSLTKGLSNADFSKLIDQIINVINTVPNILPKFILEKYSFLNRSEALLELHKPSSIKKLDRAKEVLIYEEIFLNQFLLFSSREIISREVKNFTYTKVEVNNIENKFPFKFTPSQKNVIEEIYNDMLSEKVMNRLIHGDVGCGKTAIAIAATYMAVNTGYQVAIMAPTEILATQHYETFKFIIGDEFRVELLVSKTSNKKEIYEDIKNGNINIIIGTHAIIQKDVIYNNLRLVVTDEQHRFGVRQRSVLKDKNEGNVDTLVMSATPIPRTLSMIVYGDLDISRVETMPMGRKEIYTKFVKNSEKPKLINFCKERIDKGERIYFVAPLIEENESSDLVSLDALYNSLIKSFKGYNVSKLHGKMSSTDKEEIINNFKLGKIDILVSTTVIEVGVDVPQATIIVITHVERFGLSQLHQLRGRVGRSDLKSYCFLTAGKYSEKIAERIKAMVNYSSGFDIAEIDLKLRGAGDILGTRQHGFQKFKIADFSRDFSIIKKARLDAKEYAKNLTNNELETNMEILFKSIKY